jgi:two-component system OmpR family sensor kinase
MLTELEQAFAERDATEQKLRRFLADASHELRTPLTSIQGFAELFRLGAASSPEELALVLRRIEEESARMKVLVDDLLMLARLDQPRPVVCEVVDLTVLAAEACSDARVVAKDRHFTLDAPASVVVEGDPVHLRQAVTNLVTNAIKHTPAASAVEVAVSADGGAATFRVRDHGDGLDEEALAHVFDRFWQADAARVGTGAGLGLSIVDGIVREHRGTVTASNAPGGGACFVITLPLGGALA